MSSKNNYCVIGEKLPHTLSPQIHSLFFKARGIEGSYGIREFSKQEIEGAKPELLSYDGFNITIPYKQTVMAMLDEISHEARTIGAVNTVRNDGGKLSGYNTDPYGFKCLLEVNGINPRGKSAVVLGSGGAAKSVLYALASMGVSSLCYAKREEDAFIDGYKDIPYSALKDMRGYLIVNTTPVGMYPAVGVSPVSDAIIDNFDAAVDVVYNPAMTAFVRNALSLGKRAVSGLYMLVAQAIGSQSIWRGEQVQAQEISPIFNIVQRDYFKQHGGNIYLTGLMSCGKSTLGKAYAEAMGMDFIDADSYIERREGRSISDMFAEGEEVFRAAERSAMLEIAGLSNTVVATGGGVVLGAVNRDAMRMSGTVVYIDKDVDRIVRDVDCSSRPLLAGGADRLYAIYAARKSLYEGSCHFTVSNNGSIAQGLAALKEALGED
ncbi:MAG: hypothetical protein K2M44_03620 [Clostridia bacterium]|nr:hypothetical protein [Clostridia bacterium]